MFEFIRDNQDTLKTDFITWHGDNSGHNTWDNTDEEVLEYTTIITETLMKTLVNHDIAVFPNLGNHDTWPVNVQDFSSGPNSNYQINNLKEAWRYDNWLNDTEAEMFGRFGYYSKPFPFNKNGRVLSINTQAANDDNWDLLNNRESPGGQIEWLENELKELEAANGFAYIIAHIPPFSFLH